MKLLIAAIILTSAILVWLKLGLPDVSMACTALPSAAAVTLEPLLAWAYRKSTVNTVQSSMMTSKNVVNVCNK